MDVTVSISHPLQSAGWKGAHESIDASGQEVFSNVVKLDFGPDWQLRFQPRSLLPGFK